jgi:hypothetical protein
VKKHFRIRTGAGMMNKKGCGTYVDFWKKNCGEIEDIKHSDHIILCDKCKGVLD